MSKTKLRDEIKERKINNQIYCMGREFGFRQGLLHGAAQEREALAKLFDAADDHEFAAWLRSKPATEGDGKP